MKRNLYIGATFLTLIALLGIGQNLLEKAAAQAGKGNTVQAPKFEVDPAFPKPILLGGTDVGLRVPRAIGLIRTGDTIQYANIVLESA